MHWLEQRREAARKPPQKKGEYYGYYSGGDFEVTYQPRPGGVFNIYLYGTIEDPRQFIGANEVFARAGEEDVVLIHLSTNGGSMDATDTFIQGMRETEARVIVKATGGVHSAGTIILLEADEFILSENFNCLIHNGSWGTGGKANEAAAHSKFTIEYMARTARNTYKGFMSPEEIEAMIEGKDFWFTAQEFAARWEARNALDKAQQGAAQEDVQKQLLSMIQAMSVEAAEGEAEEPPKPKKPASVRKKKTN